MLADRHRVIAVEFQGHGRTADIDRPPTIAGFAADVVGLLDHLEIERTDLFGFRPITSDVALEVVERGS